VATRTGKRDAAMQVGELMSSRRAGKRCVFNSGYSEGLLSLGQEPKLLTCMRLELIELGERCRAWK
jgi:hypothetical protein